jgi:hypothetical protein
MATWCLPRRVWKISSPSPYSPLSSRSLSPVFLLTGNSVGLVPLAITPPWLSCRLLLTIQVRDISLLHCCGLNCHCCCICLFSLSLLVIFFSPWRQILFACFPSTSQHLLHHVPVTSTSKPASILPHYLQIEVGLTSAPDLNRYVHHPPLRPASNCHPSPQHHPNDYISLPCHLFRHHICVVCGLSLHSISLLTCDCLRLSICPFVTLIGLHPPTHELSSPSINICLCPPSLPFNLPLSLFFNMLCNQDRAPLLLAVSQPT